MAQQDVPLKFQTVLELGRAGINEQAMKFSNITMESDRCVVVRESNNISIVNTKSKNVTPLNVQVDSSIMNPSTNVLGLRAQNNLQIYNLDMKTRIKSMKVNEGVLYWRWVDSKTIAYVTGTAVYHWAMDADAEPQKQFDIIPDDRQIQFINYDASRDGKWLFLQGIARGSNGIEGVLQLYSVTHKKFQPKMNAHGGCFAHLQIDGRDVTLFCFTKPDNVNGTKLFIMEVGNTDKSQTLKVRGDVALQNNDFVVSLVPSHKFFCLYAVTQKGSLFVFDVRTGTCVVQHSFPQTTFFTAIAHNESGGIVTLDRSGRVCLFHLDADKYVSYVKTSIGNLQMAIRIAIDTGLPGAGDQFSQKFSQLMAQGLYDQAAKLAAEAPGGVLRTPQTLEALQNAPVSGQGPSPDLQYYQLLLKKEVSLNEVESFGLCQRLLTPNTLRVTPAQAKSRIEKFLNEKKLTASEKLGDLLAPHDAELALVAYTQVQSHPKVALCYIQLGQVDKIIRYATSVNWTPEWSKLLVRVQQMRPEHVKQFAQHLVDNGYMNVDNCVDVLLGGGRPEAVEKTTEFLLDYLQARGDRPEDAALQTKLLEINLNHKPQVAVAILESDYNLTNYDKNYIAKLCENARLFQLALQFYESLDDIKRVLQMGLSTHSIKAEFLLKYFGDLTPEDCFSCLRDVLQYGNSGPAMHLVVEVAKRYSDFLSVEKLIALFKEFGSWNGLYLFLASKVNTTQDSNVVFKYIEAAVEVGQLQQVEQVCRENDYYDAEQVKTFLIESSKIKDPRPLIHVCDRHEYIDELTNYLYANQLHKFIQVYVTKMNPGAAPQVVGSLLDLNAPEDEIRNLVSSVRPPQCPVGELVHAVETRGRLTLLLPWLEARFHENLEDPELHNALAKIYIDINNNPMHFLMENKFYDSTVVGKYCESRDPRLAFVAYKRAAGPCDKELVDVANKHGFFKDLARYCVERQDTELWAMVLNEDNEHRRNLIDQVVSSALPECRNADQVSCTVKAFMTADLPHELIQLLEKIVLSSSASFDFRNNKNLQNLLILTAIKADPQRLTNYIDRLDNYDGADLANICISENYKLYEEAFLMFKKFGCGVEAVNVVLNHLQDLARGAEFAAYWDKPDVWSLLGLAQLHAGQVKDAIESFLKADDAQYYQEVIVAANEESEFEALIGFLQMARSKVKGMPKTIDAELVYAFARLGDLAALERFIGQPHSANLDTAGDRCFEECLFQASKLLFAQISSHGKLASTLVRLKQYQEAVHAARRANSVATWKDVCFACVDAGKFRLAQMCGLNIIVFMDHLHDVMRHYESGGHFAELIHLLEQGINLDRVHQGIYTQLGVLYAKYKEQKLMEHISLFSSRLSIPTLLQACKENLHWKEAVFLYTNYDQYDNAVDTVIQHSASCWEHEQFKAIIAQVVSTEVLYRGIDFYLQQHPLQLSELLVDLSAKLDHRRVVHTIARRNHGLIKQYLQTVQREGNSVVNEALNQLYVEEEDFEALRESVEDYHNFDHVQLAVQLQTHDLLEFRRIAASLYRRKGRWTTSIELSKRDGLWQDAMECAAESKERDLAEEILRYFVETERCPRSCFAACLFTCYDLIRPDVVLELAWRYDLKEYCMPYMVQTFRGLSNILDLLEQKIKDGQNAIDEKNTFDIDEQREAQIVNRILAQRMISYVPNGGGMF